MRSVSSGTLKQLAALDLRPSWDVRLVDQNGAVYSIPPKALKSRSRSTELDGSTWRLSLSLERSFLPSSIDPQQYHRLEIDLILGTDKIPYFRGYIDKAAGGESLQGGAILKPLELEAFGVLQKTKGYRVNSFRVDPAWISTGTTLLTGLCTTQRYTPGTTMTAGGTERLPNAGTYGATAGYLKVYTSAALSATYVQGTDYTLDTSVVPIKLTWVNAPSSARVIEWIQPERFVVPAWFPTYSSTPSFFRCPYGRRYDDLFQTYVTAIDTVNKKVTLADATGYTDRLDLTQGEYVAFTSGGVDSYRRVASFNSATKELTINAAESLPAGLAVDDGIRLATTEHYQAWDDDRLVRFFVSSAGVTEWNRTYFNAIPNLGCASPLARNWTTTETVYSDLYLVDQSSDSNRVEEIIKTLLTGLGLFTSSDITTSKTGAYVKNFAYTATDADEILSSLAPNSLPPNAFIHDEPDGTISIKPYQQKTAPDWVMRGVYEIKETDHPEPVSAVTVIALSDQEINLAPRYFNSSTNFNNPERCIDGDKSSAATPTSTSGQATLTFRIPRSTPLTSFPVIDKLRVTGQGLLSVYVTRSGTDYYLAGNTFRPLKDGSIEIPGEELHRVLLVGSTLTYQDLTFRFDPVTSGDNLSVVTVATAASVSEIEIVTSQAGVWKAELTDDTGKTPADNGASDFGSTWVQADVTLRESWRYAPPDYLKRVSSQYNAPGSGTTSKPRHKVIRRKGISQQRCRDDAERWCDELLREGKSYSVSGILDPRAQLGDTVRIYKKDGSYLDLFLWGIDDSGGPKDLSATYQFKDFGR